MLLILETTLIEPLIGIVTGDIHCCHPRVSTKKIIDSLNTVFMKTVRLHNVNFIVINGDYFDGLAQDNDPNKLMAQHWFAYLLLYCSKKNICLRLLKGTPSHDHEQLSAFAAIAKALENLDFKYVDTLSIEYIQRFDKHILYIPDEWRHDTAQTHSEVLQLLTDKGIDTVDYAFVHGQFDYQLGDVVPQRLCHKTQDYEKIVKKKIFCNHIHTHSTHSIIVAPGSIERLSQTEQSPKGVVWFEDKQDYCQSHFVVNQNATKHITINVSDMPVQEGLEYIAQKIFESKLQAGDCVRVRCASTCAIRNTISELQSKYPHLYIYIDIKKQEVRAKDIIKAKKVRGFSINRQTLSQLIKTQLDALALEPAVVQKSMEHLEDVIQSTH